LEELLREDLRAFDPRPRGPGAEDEEVRGAQLVGEAEAERLLGADDDEVDGLALRELDEGRDVVRRDGDVRRVLRGAGISRSAQELRSERGLGELPDQRVLAASAADDENFHGA